MTRPSILSKVKSHFVESAKRQKRYQDQIVLIFLNVVLLVLFTVYAITATSVWVCLVSVLLVCSELYNISDNLFRWKYYKKLDI